MLLNLESWYHSLALSHRCAGICFTESCVVVFFTRVPILSRTVIMTYVLNASMSSSLTNQGSNNSGLVFSIYLMFTEQRKLSWYPNIGFYLRYSQSNSYRSSSWCRVRMFQTQGAVSIRKTVLPGMAIPMLKIRRPNGRLIFNMEIAIRR